MPLTSPLMPVPRFAGRFFYRPALPFTQPTMSKHWRKVVDDSKEENNTITVRTASVRTSHWWSNAHRPLNSDDVGCTASVSTTTSTASSAAATICPRPLQVETWTATQSFQVGGHRAQWWCGSSYSIRRASLKFVGLPVPKIWLINQPATLTFRPLNGVTGHPCHRLPSG